MEEKLKQIFVDTQKKYDLYDKLAKEKEKDIIDFKDKYKSEQELMQNYDKLEPLAHDHMRVKFEAVQLGIEVTVLHSLFKKLGITEYPELVSEELKQINRDEMYSFVYDKEHDKLEEKEKGILQTRFKLTKNSEGYKQAKEMLEKQQQNATRN